MAAETTNYGLTKPTANESYDITVFNQNADLIDAALKELEESKAEGAALAAHEADGVKHVTAAERETLTQGFALLSDDVDTHIARTDNPHGVTAAQVGAVAKTGDTMTGDLTIKKSALPSLNFGTDGAGTATIFKNASSSVEDGLHIKDVDTDGTYAALCIKKIKGLASCLSLNFNGTSYNVYHAGNKPKVADVAGAIPFDDSRADIPEGADLNSYTAVGVYRCKNNATAGSLTNSPTTDAFVMDVVPSTGTSIALDGNYAYLIQKIMTNGNRYYARKLSTNGDVSTPVYGAWIEFYTTQNKPTPADIGAAVKYRYTATIPTGTWTAASGGGYYKDVAVSGITAAMTPCVGVVQTSDVAASELMVEEFANNISRIETMAGKIRVYTRSDGAAPSVNIPIQLVGTV